MLQCWKKNVVKVTVYIKEYIGE